jgi:HK97 family phage prohead protease
MSEIQTPALPELRHAVVRLHDVEWRDATQTGDGSYTITGHAAVFEQETVLYDLGWYRLREKIERGAFTDVLAAGPDVHLNIGHDMNRAIARTGVDGIGGLELSEDDVGLRVFARLDPGDPDVVALSSKMSRGIVDQMSFAFIVGESQRIVNEDDEGNEDVLRIIKRVAELFDVCVCAQGAYPQTEAALAMRATAQALGRAGIDLAGLTEPRSTPQEGVEPVALEQRTDEEPVAVEAGGDNQRAIKRAATRARIRVALDD